MSRPKRDPIEAIRIKITMHYYCLIADIEMSGTEVSLYVENSKDSYSKYERFINGATTPNAATFTELCVALENKQTEHRKTEQFKRLFNLSLWKVLQCKEIDEHDEHVILFKMPFEIQKSIATQNFDKMQLSLKSRFPCDKSLNYIERFSSFEALTALILILRLKRTQNKNYDDVYLQFAIYRMLLSFFHHPSFQSYANDIWLYIRHLLVKDAPNKLTQMGLEFWDHSTEKIQQIISEDKQIHDLAKQAKIIEDHTDIPSFNYLYHRCEEKQELLQIMKSIEQGEKTSMLALDGFFHNYRQLRRKGKCEIDYPTLNFWELSNEQ